ncbi:hypothetical protein KAH81_06395 [bacterium]|nr:hypothetical protein [bacterium]
MNKYLPYIIAILVVILFRAILPAPILDDAFITAHIARNLASGMGMVHNTDERIFTATTALWTFLNAGLRALNIDSVVALFILSFLSEIFLAIILIRLGKIIFNNPWIGAFTSILLTTSLPFIVSSYGGMEIALSLITIALAFLFLTEDKPNMALVISAISIWVRFDNVLLFAFIFLWIIVKKREKFSWKFLIAPFFILLSYFVFAQAYFGTPLPISVLRKAAFPNASWVLGASAIAVQFFKIAVGIADPLITSHSLHWIVLPLSGLGIYSLSSKSRPKFTPIIIFSLFYILIWTITGKTYATLFVWYFIPPLLGIFLLCAMGVVTLSNFISNGLIRKVVVSVGLIIWITATLFFANSRMDDYLETTYATREKTYSAITLWLNKKLPENSTICAGEIGAIRFYAKPTIKVLDMVGLTRPLSDKRLPINLIKEERPEAIIYWPLKGQSYAQISSIYKNYDFGDINGIMIGVRKDLADFVFNDSYELIEIFEKVKLDSENPI